MTAETSLQTFVGDLLRVLLAVHAARTLGTGRGETAPAARVAHADAELWGKITRVAEGQFLRTGGGS